MSPSSRELTLLGLAMLVMTAGYGPLVTSPSLYGLAALLLLPFLALVVHTANRPVLARHRRTVFAVTTATGAAVYSVTVTLGTTLFPGEPLWWIPGAVRCAVPFFVIGVLDRRAPRTNGTRQWNTHARPSTPSSTPLCASPSPPPWPPWTRRTSGRSATPSR